MTFGSSELGWLLATSFGISAATPAGAANLTRSPCSDEAGCAVGGTGSFDPSARQPVVASASRTAAPNTLTKRSALSNKTYPSADTPSSMVCSDQASSARRLFGRSASLHIGGTAGALYSLVYSVYLASSQSKGWSSRSPVPDLGLRARQSWTGSGD